MIVGCLWFAVYDLLVVELVGWLSMLSRLVAFVVGGPIGYLVVWLGSLVGGLVGWLLSRMVGCFVSQGGLAGWPVGCCPACLLGSLVGLLCWLVATCSWLVVWLLVVGWFVGC